MVDLTSSLAGVSARETDDCADYRQVIERNEPLNDTFSKLTAFAGVLLSHALYNSPLFQPFSNTPREAIMQNAELCGKLRFASTCGDDNSVISGQRSLVVRFTSPQRPTREGG